MHFKNIQISQYVLKHSFQVIKCAFSVSFTLCIIYKPGSQVDRNVLKGFAAQQIHLCTILRWRYNIVGFRLCPSSSINDFGLTRRWCKKHACIFQVSVNSLNLAMSSRSAGLTRFKGNKHVVSRNIAKKDYNRVKYSFSTIKIKRKNLLQR